MSFSLCAVIAEAFKRERQQLKPAAGASECTLQFTGQPRRSGCTPAEPYPPGRINNMPQEHSLVSFRIPIFGVFKTNKKCNPCRWEFLLPMSLNVHVDPR